MAQTHPHADRDDLWRIAQDRGALMPLVADHLDACLRSAVDKRDRASLVVPGGRTPAPVFEDLSNRDLPWSAIEVTLSDERWVEPTSPDSNESLLRTHLLTGRGAEARFVPLKRDGASPSETLNAVTEDLEAMVRPLDVVLLGMGADGHFASLFPGAEGLEEALDPAGFDLVCAITPDPLPENAPYPRISLTAASLLNAHSIVLLATGEDKRRVLEQAIEGTVTAEACPIRVLFTQTTAPLTIFWAP